MTLTHPDQVIDGITLAMNCIRNAQVYDNWQNSQTCAFLLQDLQLLQQEVAREAAMDQENAAAEQLAQEQFWAEHPELTNGDLSDHPSTEERIEALEKDSHPPIRYASCPTCFAVTLDEDINKHLKTHKKTGQPAGNARSRKKTK